MGGSNQSSVGRGRGVCVCRRLRFRRATGKEGRATVGDRRIKESEREMLCRNVRYDDVDGQPEAID